MQEEAFEKMKLQVGPCGITCGTCPLGNGTIAETSKKTLEYVNGYGIKEWAPLVPGGKGLDWAGFEKTIGWLTTHGYCFGCEQGGGPPDCVIRICSKERGYELCSQCGDVDGCDRFDWLGEHATTMKKNLKENKGKTKEELAKAAIKAMG